MDKIVIRLANKDEIDWINSKYSEIDFVHSNFENEIIAIAEMGDAKCGLGRIVNVDDANCELGGMFVFEEFRGLKIAEKIIEFLIDKNQKKDKNTWCLPFEKLSNFYNKFGFEDNNRKNIEVPKAVIEKHTWCNSNYDDKVLLLVK